MTAKEALESYLQQGDSFPTAIKKICGEFDMTLAEVKALLPSKEPPDFRSLDEVCDFLRGELAYCGCSYYEEALHTLCRCLEWAQAEQRPELPEPVEAVGLTVWFLYILDERDFIDHGSNVADATLTKKGARVLRGLKRYLES